MTALEANSQENWDHLWTAESETSWRKSAMASVYERVTHLIPKDSTVLELGCGRGFLAEHIKPVVRDYEGWDISAVAVAATREKRFRAFRVNLETNPPQRTTTDVVIACEVLEHLTEITRDKILRAIPVNGKAFFSVPNNRLPPSVEKQHTIIWTALQFKKYLEQYFEHVRVECLGPIATENHGAPAFLLGVCGFPKPPNGTLSVTMPVRNEESDLARTLASFMGCADEMVIGIDPRSTDATEAIAREYADVVFTIDTPRGHNTEDTKVPEDGVNFGFIRNQCMDRCTKQFTFMSEGHEGLADGMDTLLNLGVLLPPGFRVGYVWRSSEGPNSEQWAYPWLTYTADKRLRYERSTHNQLHIPDDCLNVKLPSVRTLHRRSHENAAARQKQRKAQNRITLLDDWLTQGNSNSLYYLANEMRDFNTDKSIDRMLEFLAMPSKNGPMRYQTRLQLAKEYARQGKTADARAVLIRCGEDTWDRTEHFIWLGDLAYEDDDYNQALMFYRYAATAIGAPPWSLWWFSTAIYSYLPAQRLTITYAALGDRDNAIHWARRVVELLPEDSPPELIKEAEDMLEQLEMTSVL